MISSFKVLDWTGQKKDSMVILSNWPDSSQRSSVSCFTSEFYLSLGSSLAVVTKFMAQERESLWFWIMMLSQHWKCVTG